MNILIIIKVKNLMLIKWSYSSPPHVVMLTTELRTVMYFEHIYDPFYFLI